MLLRTTVVIYSSIIYHHGRESRSKHRLVVRISNSRHAMCIHNDIAIKNMEYPMNFTEDVKTLVSSRNALSGSGLLILLDNWGRFLVGEELYPKL